MRPDRYAGWYARGRRAGGVRLRVVQERVGGDALICERDCGELDADPHELIIELQDIADSLEESVRFRLELVEAGGRVVLTTIHKAEPARASSPDAARAADQSTAALFAMMARHLENREKVASGQFEIVLGAIGTMLTNMRQVMEMQGAELRSGREERQALLLRLEVAMSGESAPASEEERTEALARANAWSRFAELGPDVAKLVLAKLGVDPRMANSGGEG